MKTISIYGGLAALSLCLAGCGSSGSTADATASESAMADTGMPSQDAEGAMASDSAAPMASDAATMGTASGSTDAMSGPDASASGGATSGAMSGSGMSTGPDGKGGTGQ